MFQFGIMIKFTLLVSILVLSTISAKPTSPNDDKNNEEAKNLLTDYFSIVKKCKNEIEKNETQTEQGESNVEKLMIDISCYQRCIYDNLGFMKNNSIDIEKMEKTAEKYKAHANKYEYLNFNVTEIDKICVNETNSKHFEGKCEPMRDFNECVLRERPAASKSQTTENN